jgi:phage minor structural protein
MAIKSILTNQEDFTGEFPVTSRTSALWRFNEKTPDENLQLIDSSGHGRHFTISGWSGTSANLIAGRFGRYFRQNIVNPTSEKTHLIAENDGSFFSNLGEKIVVGGWINPTTYSVGQTYIPIFNTRQGPGQPIFYVSLYQGRLRLMLYNSSGTLIYDQSETATITLKNGGWYFIASIIEVNNKKVQNIICDRSDGATWVSPVRSFSGELNRECIANIIMGMHANTYYYAGGFDDWFLETDSQLTADDLLLYFKSSLHANGGDAASDVDALAEPGAVTLKATDGEYPASGVLYTRAVPCALSGSGRVAVTSEYTAGVTSVSLVETSTSDDLEEWSAWQAVGTSGELQSPNRQYIRFRNGADTLEFKLPFHDPKRSTLENEKQVQIVNDIYRIRTLTDNKSEDGRVITQVYAEAVFYDLSFSAEKEPREFNADTADVPMQYALLGTGWTVGNVTVTTKRTWQCTEKNALSILRTVQNIYGGDLVFDSANRQVHLLTFSGTDSGALFSYRKNLKSIQRVVDTRELVTRLYAYGKDGLTFASINGGKEYVEDYTFSSEVRVSTLDCSSFTNPYQMLEYAKMRLAEYSKPRVSYVLSAMDLSALTGYEHEAWKLGDIVTVDDKELGLLVKTRIVRRQYNLQEPWKTVIELSTKLRELGDSSAQWDKAADALSSAELINRQEIKDMVPFNHLRNSRADDGFAYWVNSGFEVDTENGVSGTASFKAVGVPGMTKSLSQTVYPATRKSYTFSAQIASENLVKGENGQVGVEIVIEYEDGTTETRFIDLI